MVQQDFTPVISITGLLICNCKFWQPYVHFLSKLCIHFSLPRCAPGYNGEACQYTPCSSCRNGGTCSLDAEGNPVCDCTLQFTGPTCEEFTCDNYCLNGGAPSFLGGGGAGGCGCECRPGTGGDR